MAFSKYYHSKEVCVVPRSEAGFRPASGYVAAIDFGTTYCSVAYTLHGSREIMQLPLSGSFTRVPNAVLIERVTNTVVAFGYRAREYFSRLPKEQENKYIYFERMKMMLYPTPVSLICTLPVIPSTQV